MKTFEEVIRYAIRHEEREYAFYTKLADKADSTDLKNVLQKRAAEEQDHKARLEKILDEHHLPDGDGSLPESDLHLADYLIEAPPEEDGHISYQDVLIAAAKREAQAQALYLKLAESTPIESLKEVFLYLAEQEGQHKNELQKEYDENILEEN